MMNRVSDLAKPVVFLAQATPSSACMTTLIARLSKALQVTVNTFALPRATKTELTIALQQPGYTCTMNAITIQQ